MTLKKSAYRKTLGNFVTGVTVVAALDDDGAPWGLTANSFCSVSLDPPQILVCLDRRGRTWRVFSRAETFSINILAFEQVELAKHFASSTPNRFASVAWTHGEAGCPLLPGTSAWLECKKDRKIHAGDHAIMLAVVTGYGRRDVAPLGFCDGTFFTPDIPKR